MIRPLCSLVTACLIVTVGRPAPAADKPTAKDKSRSATLSPREADEDFAVQGEYSGEIRDDEGKHKVGVQIIALGDGKFHAVAYPGGLPGDGWNLKERIEADGERKEGVPTFAGEKGSGIVQDGVLIVKSSAGEEIGTLKKVQRKSPTLGRKPPKGAVVLFPMKTDLSKATLGDGEYLVPGNFEPGRVGKDGLLMQGATSKQTFQDFALHLEFMLSYMPHARGQGRSNSGTYMQGRYEVQILDSFGLKGEHNECGGIYSVKAPDVNMCFPPLSWQTFDIEFSAPRFDESGRKVAAARMTVRHNGVLIHKDVEVPKATTAAPLKEGPEPGPIYIQDHGNPLRFRNIWVVPTK